MKLENLVKSLESVKAISLDASIEALFTAVKEGAEVGNELARIYKTVIEMGVETGNAIMALLARPAIRAAIIKAVNSTKDDVITHIVNMLNEFIADGAQADLSAIEAKLAELMTHLDGLKAKKKAKFTVVPDPDDIQ